MEEKDKLKIQLFDALFGGDHPYVNIWLRNDTGAYYIGTTTNPVMGVTKELPLGLAPLIQEWEKIK